MLKNDTMISIIVPAFNEEGSIKDTVSQILDVISSECINGEVIIVDDGSTDRTGQILDELSRNTNRVKVLHHRKNLGKTEALAKGFNQSKGDVIIFFDADLQYDPKDIPRYIEKILVDNYDVVTGWRTTRSQAEPLPKLVAGRIFNSINRILFRMPIHDFNCGLRGFKAEVLENIPFRAGNHRNILITAESLGYKISEIPVIERARIHGKSKYGSERLLEGGMDLLALKFRLSFFKRPMLLFGILSLLTLTAGLFLGVFILIEKYIFGVVLIHVHLPLLLLTVLLILSGLQFLSFGFIIDCIADLSQEKPRRKIHRNCKDGK